MKKQQTNQCGRFPTIMESLHTIKSLQIRAFRKEADCTTFYTVIVKQGTTNSVLCNIVLPTGEVAYIKNMAGKAEFMSMAGLTCPTDKMFMYLPGGVKLGDVCHSYLIINRGGVCSQMELVKSALPTGHNFDDIVVVTKAERSQKLAHISCSQQSSTVTIDYLHSSLASTEKAGILLTAFKFYHTFYELSKFPIPKARISTKLLPCLERLKSYNHFRFRPQCTAANNCTYIDITYCYSNEILLTAEVVNEQLIYVNDVHNTRQFRAVYDECRNRTSVLDFNECNIGSWSGCRYTDNHCPQTIMLLKKKSVGHRQMKCQCHTSTALAAWTLMDACNTTNPVISEFIPENDGNTALLTIASCVSVRRKALIIAGMVGVAIRELAFFNQCLPHLLNYPYESTC